MNEREAFEAWFKEKSPVCGINAKLAARDAWLARAAVEADRAQRVPEGWVLIATDAYEAGFGKGEQAHKTGKDVENPWGDDPGREAWAMGYALGKERAASTPAPAQQEPDWKDMYEKEKRRSAMWIAKYEKDIGPLECAGPVSHQEPSPQERKPMTPEQVAETVFEVNGNEPSALFWRDLVSAVERRHGIKE